MNLPMVNLKHFLMSPEAYQDGAEKIKCVETFDSHLYFSKKGVYKQLKNELSLPLKERRIQDSIQLAQQWSNEQHEWGMKVLLQLNEPAEAFQLIDPENLAQYKSLSGWQINDYLFKTPRLADSACVQRKIEKKIIDTELIEALANFLNSKHKESAKPDRNTSYGSAQHFHEMAEALGYQAKKYATYGMTQAMLDTVFWPWKKFIDETRWSPRRKKKRVVRLHGKFSPAHLFIEKSGFVAISAIDRGSKIAYGDVAYDVATMANHLFVEGQEELAGTFINHYIHLSKDEALLEILPAYRILHALQHAVQLAEQVTELLTTQTPIQDAMGRHIKSSELEKQIRPFCDITVQMARSLPK